MVTLMSSYGSPLCALLQFGPLTYTLVFLLLTGIPDPEEFPTLAGAGGPASKRGWGSRPSLPRPSAEIGPAGYGKEEEDVVLQRVLQESAVAAAQPRPQQPFSEPFSRRCACIRAAARGGQGP